MLQDTFGTRNKHIDTKYIHMNIIIESHRDKTNKIICAPSEDSDQPEHLPSLIRVFAWRTVWSLATHKAHKDSDQTGRTCHFVGFVMMRLSYLNISNLLNTSPENWSATIVPLTWKNIKSHHQKTCLKNHLLGSTNLSVKNWTIYKTNAPHNYFSIIVYTPANYVCGGYTIFTSVSIRLSIRDILVFFNILKRQWWKFISFCRHINIDDVHL